ncbi:GEVED domain-containing protein [Flavobacterium sp.]|uniref:GEVED domain-containing protein n=1 Tax=Flavobacterium sp. TaxID=239 RepID=UPI00391D64CA
MKNNYKTIFTCYLKVFTVVKKSFFLFLLLTTSYESYSQVVITKPNLSISVCSGYPSGYKVLGDIVVTEAANGNFSAATNHVIDLVAPTNFEFLAGTGTVAFVGGRNISAAAISVTASMITITYSVSGTNRTDAMTISGIQVRATNTASTGDITRNTTRVGVTHGAILGLVNGTTVTNTLTSTTGTAPSSAYAGTDQTLTACTTSTTLSGNTPAVGTGTWSVVTGTATITTPNSPTSGVTGLALGTSATLRWTISNGSCDNSFDDVIITTAYGSSCLTYCSVGGNTPATSYISNVTLNTINQNNTAWNGYINYYPSISTNLIQSNSYTISVTIWNQTTSQKNISAWIDWNLNGVFDIATETVLSTTSTVAAAQSVTVSNTFTVPGTAVVDLSRLRVELAFNAEGAATPCNTNSLTDAQDYKINVQAILPCSTPTAQATNLILTPGGTSVLGTFTAASPAPNSYLVIRNTSGTIPTPVNGTTYTIGGTVGAGNTVVDIDNDTTFTATGLTISTQYHFFVFSFNSSCTGGPLYLNTTPLNGNTTTLSTNYCIPTGNLNCTTNGDYIANVTLNTLVNNTTCSSAGYTNYPPTGAQTTTVTRGNTYNLSVGTGIGNKKHGLAAWIDFNQNQVFDATEYFTFGNGVIANSINTIAVAIPAGAALGSTRMRIRYGRQTNITSSSSCTMNGTFGETEDYTITIIDPIVCVAPTSQPSSLILNSTGTTINGSFTAPSPAPNNYLVVINTTGTTPTPVNGTSYSIGGTVGVGNTVVDNDSNVTFLASGLSATTTYYIFVFAYNSSCTGGPAYNTTTPLNGSIATIISNYCTPSVSNGREDDNYLTEVSFIGTLNDVSNYSTYSSTPLGYQDFTNLTNLCRQAQGYGVNVSVQATYSSFMKAWVDWNKDGTFDNTTEMVYNSGTISTGSTTFGFIIPSGQALGNYRIRIRVDLNGGLGSTTFTPCGNLNNGGETEDYLFTVVASCNAAITSITDGRTCGPGTVNLETTSAVVVPTVSEFRWYTTPTGATLVATTATGIWTTPSLSATTTYYVTAYNGCESLTRTAVTAIVSPIPTLTYLPVNPTSCGEDVGVELSATGDVEEVHLINEMFNSGLGTFTNTNITSSVRNADTQWQNRTSTYIPTAISGVNTWYPAVSSGVTGNGFAMATSDFANAIPYVHNQIASSTVSTVNFTSLTLSLRLFYSRYFIDGAYPTDEYATIDVSTNNGSSWIEIKRFTEDVGIGTRFETLTYDLSAYIGVNQLKVRVRYYNNNWCDGIAVDDIKLFGNRPNVNLNWDTTIPAFTDAACTIAYDPLTTAPVIYVKPTLAQLELASFNFSVNAILDNGCLTSQVITVTNKTKIWNGTDSLWDDDENWMPLGKPDSSNCIIIPDTPHDPIISGTNYEAYGKNITVKSGGNLTIESNNNITITDEVLVKTGGLFDIKNSASLIQINDTAINNGFIKMTRTTRPMTRWGYVYWGTPVAENIFSQIPSQFDLKYRWQSGTSTGAWMSLSSVVPGQGFITRVSNIAPFSTGTGTIDFVFQGTPGNGAVTVPVDSFDASSTVAGNTVLLSNPYPSAIDGEKFLKYGISPTSLPESNSELGGTLFFWTSITLYNGLGPYNVLDYASWNLSGGVGTAPSTDPSNASLKPNGKIAAGQGFFAQVYADGNITFNNSMRVMNDNNQFFRTSNFTTDSENSSENNRIWLNLYSDNTFRQMMVNYKAEATNGFDTYYDGVSFTNNEINLYSILNDKSLAIQGRALPFDENDVVPLGYKITNPGMYSIAVDELDGLFLGDQTIYLRDNLLSIDHNIKQSPYTFNSVAGTFENRFEIVYVTNALNVNNPDNSNTFATISNNTIKVTSSEFIESVKIFDISGKLINHYNLSNASKQLSDSFNYPNGIYIAEIKLENDIVVKKKLIH